MKRPIKFRGKCIRTGKWVYGYLSNKDVIQPESGSRLKVDPETIGQYTGLKDKNGVEIYEGDMLRRVNHFEDEKPYYTYHQVIWFQDAWFQAWNMENETPKTGNGNCALWVYDPNKNGEVIGNIYENPEILEK